jgi:hypothetical protein
LKLCRATLHATDEDDDGISKMDLAVLAASPESKTVRVQIVLEQLAHAVSSVPLTGPMCSAIWKKNRWSRRAFVEFAAALPVSLLQWSAIE